MEKMAISETEVEEVERGEVVEDDFSREIQT